MDKKKEIVGSSDTPVITDKKVTTTPPTTSIGATAPSQSEEEEYNEQPPTPQAPPTTPAPTPPATSTIQTPQYNDTDRRNQANLAAQTTTAPTANENMILQFDKDHNPTLVNTDVATPKITPKTTDTAPTTDATPSTEGEEFRSYRDILAKYAPLTSDEDKKKQMRRERRKAIVSALGDGLSALSNLYFTTKGAPDQGLKPGMTDSAKKRMDDLRAKWQAEKDKYQEFMLKGLEMDREQGNWLKSYKLQLNADKRADAAEKRSAEEFKKKLPLLEKQLQAAGEELKKLIRENNIGNATWEKAVEVAKKKYEQELYELEFMKTHKGLTPKEYYDQQETRSYHNRVLAARGGRGGGKTYRIYNYNSTAYSDLTPNEVNRLYAALQSDGKVGKYSSLNDKVAAIQRYHSLNNDTYEVEVPVYYEDKDGKKKLSKQTKKVTRRYKNRKDDAANGGRYDKMSTWTTVNGGNKSNGIIKINY